MNVDPIARIYRIVEYAAFGRTLEQCRCQFLSDLQTAREILIVGEGDGRFLQRLLSANSAACVTVIELSEAMIALARERIEQNDQPRVSFRRGDIRTIDLARASYDAVITNFILDCFDSMEAESVIGRLATALRIGGTWIVGEFRLPAGGFALAHARLWLSAMYAFFRLTTGLRVSQLPDYDKLLKQCGLILHSQHLWRFGLVTSQLWRKLS